jgi:hypothetical protein
VHLGGPHHHHHHKPPKKPVKRKLVLGEGVACCAAEALAASLRLAGVPVGDEDVLALYWRTAADAEAGATILETLEAASEFGLDGQEPRWAPVAHPLEAGSLVRADPGAVLDQREIFLGAAAGASDVADIGNVDLHLGPVHPASVVLGVTLPGGPHAIALDPSGAVWSWGELYDLTPDVAIDEAWEVTWRI